MGILTPPQNLSLDRSGGLKPTELVKAVIWQEDGVWCGSEPALPGCHTWGDSYEHLLEMLQDAIQGWLEVASQREDIDPRKRSPKKI